MLLVTGGAGFIGSNFVVSTLSMGDEPIVNLDLLTYAGNLRNLQGLFGDARHIFVHGDIADRPLLRRMLAEYRPRAVLHFAAESHVDRSIHGPSAFVQTNIVGTFALLEEVRAFWETLVSAERAAFRFLHVSTDEVYGSLDPDEAPFSESRAYAPNSPYAASKAGSDHLVRAYNQTYGLPVLTTNCSNNYGPYQFPEKLVPLIIRNVLAGQPLPVYGDGLNVRDWLYVGDHCSAIREVLAHGKVGETYNIGGNAELANIGLVRKLCDLIEAARPSTGAPYTSQVTHVRDRPGHDRRYAIDASKIRSELGWEPRETLDSGLAKTVRWYLDNLAWVNEVTTGAYRNWIDQNYAERESV